MGTKLIAPVLCSAASIPNLHSAEHLAYNLSDWHHHSFMFPSQKPLSHLWYIPLLVCVADPPTSPVNLCFKIPLKSTHFSPMLPPPLTKPPPLQIRIFQWLPNWFPFIHSECSSIHSPLCNQGGLFVMYMQSAPHTLPPPPELHF